SDCQSSFRYCSPWAESLRLTALSVLVPSKRPLGIAPYPEQPPPLPPPEHAAKSTAARIVRPGMRVRRCEVCPMRASLGGQSRSSQAVLDARDTGKDRRIAA